MICNKCKQDLPKSSFGIQKTRGKEYTKKMCKSCNTIYQREWYQKNRATDKEYREKDKARCKSYYEANQDRWVEYNKEYRKNNPEKIKEWARRGRRVQRERQKELDFLYTKADERATRIAFPRCANCNSSKNLELDHFYPLSKGFGLALDNAIILCRTCNASKNDKLPEDFFTENKYLDIEYKLSLLEAGS